MRIGNDTNRNDNDDDNNNNNTIEWSYDNMRMLAYLFKKYFIAHIPR